MVMIMNIMMMIWLIMMTSMLTYGKQLVWENMKENKEGLKMDLIMMIRIVMILTRIMNEANIGQSLHIDYSDHSQIFFK